MPAGVYVANVTPFAKEVPYEVDRGAYLEHVSWLSESGVRGIVPFGTNGEGASVSMREKLVVLGELFARKLPLEVIPVVMEGNLPDTLEMVEELNGFSVRAVLVLPPYYVKPASVEGLKRFYEPVLAASEHPVILYHIPKYAVPVPPGLVKDLPVWGVKDSGGEGEYAEEILAAGKGVLIGTEDDLWQRLNLGAQGVISALANFVPEQVVEIYRAAESGDEALGKFLSDTLKETRAMTKQYASTAVLKRLAEARHGVPMGTVRPPFVPAPEDYDPEPVLRVARVEAGA